MRPMRALLALLAALVLGLAAIPAQAAGGSRQATLLSAGWLFAKGDPPGAARPDFDDVQWTRVTLPHTFNAGESGDGEYYRGPGWYRRAFDIASLGSGRRLFAQFDGAALIADVYLNGAQVCRHEGGHAAFRCDLTGKLVPGRNLLAVRVDNAPSRVVSPLGGDFTVFGGLYRPVSLIEADSLHFDLLDHGGPGVYARATEIGPAAAQVRIEAKVANDGDRRGRVPVSVRVLDAAGREVARSASSLEVPARSVRTAALNVRIASPRLWDGVRDPYLYRVVARIGEDGDQATVPLGIRSFAFDPSRGFLLNGRPYALRGANLMHSARPGKGTAVTDAEVAEDFAILREMGSTGVRLVHFQHPRSAYDQADRLGMPVWTEIGINSEIEDTPEFRANAAQQLRELIAQAYNHPSVVLWGLGNEVYADGPHVERVLRELHEVAKSADPSRPTVYAHCCQADDHPKALVSDVIGFNRYFGWYPQDGTMDSWAAGFHAAHPDRAFAVSEYGAGASILHQQDPPPDWVEPVSGWHPEQYQTRYHEQNWLALKDKPYLWGTFVWVAFDLASAGRHEGDRRGINDKGLVTYDRQVRKDAWYWYQAWWSEHPMLHITSRRFTDRHDPAATVKAYTNAAAATLFVNGQEIGTQPAENRTVTWPIVLREGANEIEVRAAAGGEPLSDKVIWIYRDPPGMLGASRSVEK
jgi:beta-galactosidase/beta-glucuronidase